MRKLIWVVIILVVGFTAGPFIVAALMDVFAVTIFSVFGVDLGLGFVKNTLGFWPGGNIIAAIAFGGTATPASLISGLLQVLLVAIVRALIPSVKGWFDAARTRRHDTGRTRRLGFGALVAIGLLDTLVTCLVAIAVGFVCTGFFGAMFESWIGVFAQVVIGIAEAVLIAVCVLVVFKTGRGVGAAFALSVVVAFIRFVLATVALVTWSVNNIAGALTVVVCVLACGALAFVTGPWAQDWDNRARPRARTR